MLLLAIPVCDLCKATARYGKETDNTAGEKLECNGYEEVKAPIR